MRGALLSAPAAAGAPIDTIALLYEDEFMIEAMLKAIHGFLPHHMPTSDHGKGAEDTGIPDPYPIALKWIRGDLVQYVKTYTGGAYSCASTTQ